MKGVCYTAIVGKYDHLKDPKIITPNWDYVCFTDQPHIVSNIWRIVRIDSSFYPDQTKLARQLKILGHPDIDGYSKSIWIDGSVEVQINLDTFIQKYQMQDENIMLAWHGGRKCLYDEARICIKIGKDKPDVIKKQILSYKLQRYPSNNGLVQTGILVRNHNEATRQFNLAWWAEVSKGSKRDQLSFNYVAWKLKNTKIKTINPSIFYNEFQLFNHTPYKERLKVKKAKIRQRRLQRLINRRI